MNEFHIELSKSMFFYVITSKFVNCISWIIFSSSISNFIIIRFSKHRSENLHNSVSIEDLPYECHEADNSIFTRLGRYRN